MEHRIAEVAPHSIAGELGIAPGDFLTAIDAEEVVDVVDYTYKCARERLCLSVRKADGEEFDAEIEKDEDEGLGIGFDSGLMSKMRCCHNNCVFCFVDQMPKGLRNTLYVKDDDWRMSFIMGNFVTLTNVGDGELQRIIDRRVSPLYVSVHATDPELRVQLTRNPKAGRLMGQLRALTEAGLSVHCQNVLCPGLNDGEALERTLTDLWSLGENVASVAVVPVGLTRYREGLSELRPFDVESAGRLLEQVEGWQARCLAQRGTRFVFAADEFYAICGRETPATEAYEGYPQIENGIGMLRKFEDELDEALLDVPAGCAAGRRVTVATGTSATSFLRRMAAKVSARTGMDMTVRTVENRFFGPTVTVAGLLTAGDLIEALRGRVEGEGLLIARNMLRENEDVFLDGGTLNGVREALGCSVTPVWNDGEAFLHLALSDKTEAERQQDKA